MVRVLVPPNLASCIDRFRPRGRVMASWKQKQTFQLFLAYKYLLKNNRIRVKEERDFRGLFWCTNSLW